MRRARWAGAIAATAAAIACGGTGGDGHGATADPDAGITTSPDGGAAPPSTPPDAGAGDASTFACAKHAPIPRIKYWGGPILHAPEVVTITFQKMDATIRGKVEAFDDAITSSAWWDRVLAGYCDDHGKCIGHGTSGGHVTLAESPAATYTDSQIPGHPRSIVDFVQAHVTSGDFPPPHEDTLYTMYFPAGVSFSLDGAPSCGFAGYHFAADIVPKGETQPVRVAYAVMPTCFDQAPPADVAALLMGVASHELIEAATDAKSVGPDVRNADWGFYMEDPAWGVMFGGQEVGDLCGRYSEADADGVSVTRGWIHDTPDCAIPCGPAASDDVYYGVAPETQLVELAIGESATIAATAFSQAPMADWKVTLVEPDQVPFGEGYGGHVEISIEGGTPVSGDPASAMVNNGTPLKLHLKLVSAPPEDQNFPSKTDQRFHHAFVELRSRIDSKHLQRWPFTVRQKT